MITYFQNSLRWTFLFSITYLIISLNITYAEELNLPKSYYCETQIVGGLLKNSDGRWSVGSLNERDSFTLNVRKFNTGTNSEIEQCDTAILASGKKTDDYSKWRRENGSDVCAIQTFRDLKVGPTLRYCKLLNGEILCDDFAFSSKYLEYFELPPPSLGLHENSMVVFHGTCKSL